jgi:hypothetical protein
MATLPKIATRAAAIICCGITTAAIGCNALLDIDGVEFGDPVVTTSQGGSGAGGSGAQGGGGGSTTSTGGAGMGGGTGGIAPPSPEDCNNGMDDNGDGLADCADPLCACVEPAPMNWIGPVVLAAGGSAANCPADWPTETERGLAGTLTAPPASCTACSCGGPQGLGCTRPSVTLYNSPSCSGVSVNHNFNSNSCETVSGSLAVTARGSAPQVTGQCPPSGGVETVPPASFDETAVLCGGSFTGGDSCAITSLCVPLPPPPFESKICVYRNANVPCPAPYTELVNDYFETISDSRGCTSCSCGAPQAGCSGTSRLYSDSSCNALVESVPNNNSCEATTATASVRYFPNAISGNGACSDSGGDPTGSAAGSGNVRVCCLP